MPVSAPSLQHAVIAGAGLAGTLMAVLLARRGVRVTLLERRPDLRKTLGSAGRSINLALSTRGRSALAAAGLEEAVAAFALPMYGRRMHGIDGTRSYHAYGRPGQAILSVSRRRLNEVLLDAAESTGLVRLVFNARVTDVEPDAGLVIWEDDAGTQSVVGDLVIGADGAWSAVRQRMMRNDRFDYSQSYISHGYKELTIPPLPDGSWALEPDGLHIWPRQDFMLIALPNPDRTFTCTLFLDVENASPSFAELTSSEAVQEFFGRWFADTLPVLPALQTEFFENPTGSLQTVRCGPWNAGRAILIGDAAHAVVPFYGQGMNASFEDARLLDEALAAGAASPVPAVLAAWARARKPDGDAIADLALENFVEMRAKVSDPKFLRRKALETTLMTAFPDQYLSLYGMVTFSNIPYAQARDIARAQDQTWDDHPEAALALLTLAWVRRWMD